MERLPDMSPLLSWYEDKKRDFPWRKTKDPYLIWVSEIMLQQTRIEAALPYYDRFIRILPTVKDLAEAPEALLLKLWEGLGYYSRVRNMQKAAKTIMTAHGGEFPCTFEEIRALCGIGDYTAGAIASFAFGLSHPAIDGNVLRVSARLLAYPENVLAAKPKKYLTEKVADSMRGLDPATFNQAIMELGETVCLPNGRPLCELCPLQTACLAHGQGVESTLPVRQKQAERKKEDRTVLIIKQNNSVLLRKRPTKGLLAGLFEPLCLEGALSEPEVRETLRAWGITPKTVLALGPTKHVFSHVEWHMTGFEITLPPTETPTLPDGYFFAPRGEIDTHFALPSAYRAYRPFF